MKQRLPSLNALRAFDAVATRLSFTRAAKDLNVTPGAVRYLVNELEQDLGVKLLDRRNRKLALTNAAQAGVPILRSVFARLPEAVERMTDAQAHHVLTVRVTPSFAANWLVPRLDHLSAAFPDLDIRLSASQELVDFTRDDVDILLRHDDWEHGGLHSDRLFYEEVFPVCSPGLMNGRLPLKVPGDLRRHTLIHLRRPRAFPPWPDWRDWLITAGVDGVDTSVGPQFSLQGMAHQAAARGQGVALGSVSAADELADGSLVRPFELSIAAGCGFRLFCRKDALTRAGVKAFREWLLAEAKESFGRWQTPPTADN